MKCWKTVAQVKRHAASALLTVEQIANRLPTCGVRLRIAGVQIGSGVLIVVWHTALRATVREARFAGLQFELLFAGDAGSNWERHFSVRVFGWSGDGIRR